MGAPTCSLSSQSFCCSSFFKFAATATLSRSNTWPPRINPQTQPTLPRRQRSVRRQGSLRLKYQINSSSVRMPVVTFTQDQDIAINITSAVTEFLPNFTYSCPDGVYFNPASKQCELTIKPDHC